MSKDGYLVQFLLMRLREKSFQSCFSVFDFGWLLVDLVELSVTVGPWWRFVLH